jgi:hypothetical protein
MAAEGNLFGKRDRDWGVSCLERKTAGEVTLGHVLIKGGGTFCSSCTGTALFALTTKLGARFLRFLILFYRKKIEDHHNGYDFIQTQQWLVDASCWSRYVSLLHPLKFERGQIPHGGGGAFSQRNNEKQEG